MQGITRYILRQIAWPLLFASLTLAGVIWLTQALRFIDRIVNNNLTFGTFFYLAMLVVPSVLMIILPVATFCATLYAYNRLATDSELTVLSAVGYSRLRLARPALMLAALIMALLYCISLYIGPLSARTLRTAQFEFRSNLAGLLLVEGVFNTPTPTLTVYIRERDPDGVMRGILVHDNRESGRPVTMMAERAALVLTPQGPRLVMENGNRQQIEAGRKSLNILYFDNYSLDLQQYGKSETEGWREPSERYLTELFSPNLADPDDRANANKLLVEAHRRLAAPFYVPALVLIAIAGVLGGEFNRRGHTKRVVLAAAAAILLQIISLGITQAAVKIPLMIPLLYVAPLAFAVLGYLALREKTLPRRLDLLQESPA